MSDYDLILASLAAINAKLDTLQELLELLTAPGLYTVQTAGEWHRASHPPPYNWEPIDWPYGGNTSGTGLVDI